MPVIWLLVILRIPPDRGDGQTRSLEPLVREDCLDFRWVGVIRLLSFDISECLLRSNTFERTLWRCSCMCNNPVRELHFGKTRFKQACFPFPPLGEAGRRPPNSL